jgi:glucan biosynthesis protein C
MIEREQAMTNDTQMRAATRYDFLDWLRVIAIFVLLFYHTGMMFVGWDWHIQNRETLDALKLPMSLAHRLRMPLLFLIAGAGMWFALRSRTGMQMIRERSLRLALPLVLGMFIIVSPQVYVERIVDGDFSGGYVAFFLERVLRLQPYPAGDFSWHHLWFIAYLYVYVLIATPLLLWWKRARVALRPGLWLYAPALLLGFNEALLKPIFPESHNLISDWYTFNHYFLLMLSGYLLASMPGSWEWLEGERRRALGIGLVILGTALILIEAGVIVRGTAADSIVANLFTWVWLMVFIGYGRRYLSFQNPLLRWARDASYPVYILHQTVIVLIGYYVIQMDWTPWAKYWLVLGVTLVSCVVLYQFCIRRFAALRLMFGLKLEGKARRPIEAPATVG